MYVKYFTSEYDAIERCALKNKACRRAGNLREIYAVAEGPSDDWAVVDIDTAIDLGNGYFVAD